MFSSGAEGAVEVGSEGASDFVLIGLLLAVSPGPFELNALITNVYVVPDLSPFMLTDGFLVVTTLPPGLTVTVYFVIFVPPVNFGALHFTVALLRNPAPEIPVGRPGPARSFAALDGAETSPEPTAFIAVTVNV